MKSDGYFTTPGDIQHVIFIKYYSSAFVCDSSPAEGQCLLWKTVFWIFKEHREHILKIKYPAAL